MTVEPLHFPSENKTKFHCSALKVNEPLFSVKPQTHVSSKPKRYFSFMDVMSKISEDCCSVSNIKILHIWLHIKWEQIDYIEIPLSSVKSRHYRNII